MSGQEEQRGGETTLQNLAVEPGDYKVPSPGPEWWKERTGSYYVLWLLHSSHTYIIKTQLALLFINKCFLKKIFERPPPSYDQARKQT